MRRDRCVSHALFMPSQSVFLTLMHERQRAKRLLTRRNNLVVVVRIQNITVSRNLMFHEVILRAQLKCGDLNVGK